MVLVLMWGSVLVRVQMMLKLVNISSPAHRTFILGSVGVGGVDSVFVLVLVLVLMLLLLFLCFYWYVGVVVLVLVLVVVLALVCFGLVGFFVDAAGRVIQIVIIL